MEGWYDVEEGFSMHYFLRDISTISALRDDLTELLREMNSPGEE
jgi:hypothetical protein